MVQGLLCMHQRGEHVTEEYSGIMDKIVTSGRYGKCYGERDKEENEL